MARTSKKPSSIVIEPVRARAVRGPHPKNPKSWYWRPEYHHDGTTESFKSFWATRDEARERITELLAAKGIDRLVEERRVVRGEVTHLSTVEHLMRAFIGWWEEKDDAKPATLKIYRFAARRLVKHIGDVRVARLDLPVLERYRRDRQREWKKDLLEQIERTRAALVEAKAAVAAPDAPESARRRVRQLQTRRDRLERRRAKPVLTSLSSEFKVLRAAWNWAQERIDGFPRHRLRVRTVAPSSKDLEESSDNYRPSVAEFWAVMEHLDGWALRACLLLAATGARKKEIATARWEGFDAGEGTLLVDGKTGERTVALPAPTIEMLLEIQPPPPVGRIIGEVTVSTFGSWLGHKLRRACEETGVRPFTVHGIRRMVTDRMYSSGSDPSAAAAQLGHSVKVALQHYRKAKVADKKRAVALAGLGAPPEQAKVVSLDAQRKKSG
jgi:integrase